MISLPHLRSFPRPPVFRAVRIAVGLAVVPAFSALPGAAVAQEVRVAQEWGGAPQEVRVAEGPGETQEPPSAGADAPLRWHLTVLAGTRGLGGDTHGFGGVEGMFLPARFGAALSAQVGTGYGYGSTLLAGGLGARVARVEEVDLLAWVGPAFYRESLEAGFDRSMWGAGAGATARRSVGRLALSLHLAWTGGRFEGEDFQEAVNVSAFRFALGIGLGGGG